MWNNFVDIFVTKYIKMVQQENSRNLSLWLSWFALNSNTHVVSVAIFTFVTHIVVEFNHLVVAIECDFVATKFDSK